MTAVGSLSSHGSRVTDGASAKKLDGVGEKIAKKVQVFTSSILFIDFFPFFVPPISFIYYDIILILLGNFGHWKIKKVGQVPIRSSNSCP